MKKLGRDPEKLETLNLFSLLHSNDGNAVYDPTNRQSFLSQVDSGLTRALDSEGTLHGIRVQSMFRGMVANLDYVRLVKEEDSSTCYYNYNEKILIPDFRIVTADEKPLLVETKNHYSKAPLRCYSIRTDDLSALKRYADIVHSPLRIAIYWAHWNLWTLNDPERFVRDGTHSTLEFMRALKQSEMATLGDYSIATTYPITLKLNADLTKPRAVSPDRIASMRIGSWEIRVADEALKDKTEQNIALYLMMYGKWIYDGGRIELDEAGLPSAAVHTVSPENITPHQGFEMVGSVSSLYSQHYNALTMEGGRVARLNLKEPSLLAPIIPRDLAKKQLPLWRFIQNPHFD